MLLESQAPPELVGHLEGEPPRRVASHPLELFTEMGLVVVVGIELALEEIVRLPLGPSPVELLKAEDSGQDFRGKTDMPLEEQFQVAPRVTRLPRQLFHGEPAIS